MSSALAFPESEERLIRTQRELDELYRQLEQIDNEILRAVTRRTQLSRLISHRLRQAGLPHEPRETDRYGALGADGRAVGRMLARLAGAR
jgi:chorismate mutase